MSTVEFDPAKIDFFTDETVAADSDPYFDHMLASYPVWREPKYGVVIVTGYEEALEVYHHPEIYSSINRTAGPVLVDLPVELAGDDLTDILEQYREYFPENDQMVTFDPPMHTDHRALLMGLITPKRLKENEDFLRSTADRLLDDLLPKGQCQFIREYARPYAVLSVADLLGVPESDQPLLLDALTTTRTGLGDLKLRVSYHNRLEAVYDYFIEKIEERRASPRDDVLTGMARATFPDGTLPEPVHVARIASNLFAAGGETTVQLFGLALARLADDQELQDALRADPALVPRFIEETLRISAPIKGSFRLTKRPTVLGGLDVAPGTVVMLLHGAAGRDPRMFDQPAEFDVKRPNARQHLAFGRGIHTCPGAPLARAETVISIQRMLERTERISIDEEQHGPADDRRWQLIPGYKFRGHKRLFLRFEERSGERSGEGEDS